VCGSPTNFTLQKDAGFVFVSKAEIGYYSPKYRVSIKSFPDYKYLLQENFVEQKHIFLPLLKLVSKKKKLLELSYI